MQKPSKRCQAHVRASDRVPAKAFSLAATVMILALKTGVNTISNQFEILRILFL